MNVTVGAEKTKRGDKRFSHFSRRRDSSTALLFVVMCLVNVIVVVNNFVRRVIRIPVFNVCNSVKKNKNRINFFSISWRHQPVLFFSNHHKGGRSKILFRGVGITVIHNPFSRNRNSD
jgi:type IV secretory pathway VirB3-like protein